MSARRLTRGGLVNRDRVLNFTLDGRSYSGFEGDTVGSALLANGVSVLGRSFKYHRPRGIMTAGSEEPNALLTIGDGAFAIPKSTSNGCAASSRFIGQDPECVANHRF